MVNKSRINLETVKEMRDNNYLVKDIAKALGVGRHTISRALKRIEEQKMYLISVSTEQRIRELIQRCYYGDLQKKVFKGKRFALDHLEPLLD